MSQIASQRRRPLMTPNEAARAIGIDKVSKSPERLVRDMARRGELVGVKVGRSTMIDPKSVDRYLSDRA